MLTDTRIFSPRGYPLKTGGNPAFLRVWGAGIPEQIETGRGNRQHVFRHSEL